MANHPTYTWIGASGKKYVHEIHARHPKLPPNQPGNYIYAKLDKRKRWVPIYIGEGNLTQSLPKTPSGGMAAVDESQHNCS